MPKAALTATVAHNQTTGLASRLIAVVTETGFAGAENGLGTIGNLEFAVGQL